MNEVDGSRTGGCGQFAKSSLQKLTSQSVDHDTAIDTLVGVTVEALERVELDLDGLHAAVRAPWLSAG